MQTSLKLETLTDGQALALSKVQSFLTDPAQGSFALLGGAGVGKTFLASQIVKMLLEDGWRTLVAAPTHKACRVLRSKLDAAGIEWAFKPRDEVKDGVAVVDTTAALLGIRPVISDDQDEKELSFKASASGSLVKLLSGNTFAKGTILVIDEVSMLGRDDLLALQQLLAGARAKLLVIGDDGQLPPVKKQAIDFASDFSSAHTLDEVVRQAKGSSIVNLAWAVRNSSDGSEALERLNMAALLGGDVEQVEKIGAAFLEQLELPVNNEAERSVFIAYTNKVVNYIQEHACQKIYGHGSTEFREGELVIATSAGYTETYGTYVDWQGRTMKSKWPKLEQVVAVADQLRVLEIVENHSTLYGALVKLERVDLPEGAEGRVFSTHYLPAELQGKESQHPFAIKKASLLAEAQRFQSEMKKGQSEGQKADTNDKRKKAWQAYFAHCNAVLSFAHPFAITSHKSQGSTYREAYVAVGDLLAHNKAALYVAVTRPSKKLVV